MRIALVSDIHGNLPALEAVVADIRRRGADLIANLGDSVSGPLWPLETAQFLMAENWHHIAGNHERQLLTLPHEVQNLSDRYAKSCLGSAELAWLAAQRPAMQLNDEVFLCHGTPDNDCRCLLESTLGDGHPTLSSPAKIRERLGSVRTSLVACGHSHLPRSVSLGGQWLVNPGSVGLPAYEDDQPLMKVETGSPDARYAIAEQHTDGWRVALYSVPYRHALAVDQARRNGREDWAVALGSGFND